MECPPPAFPLSNFHKSRVRMLLFTVVGAVLAEPISPRALILSVSAPQVQSAGGRSLLQLEPAGQ